jgi:hypothetical protein
MGYYVRAFCTASMAPPLGVVLNALAARGIVLAADAVPPEDLRASDWEEATLGFGPNQRRFVVTCDRETSPGHTVVREEVQQFIEFLQDGPPSPERKRVVDHLRATRFIIACRFPAAAAADDDEGGCAAGRGFLSYFVAHCGGLVQADGEGFYEGDRIVLAVE